MKNKNSIKEKQIKRKRLVKELFQCIKTATALVNDEENCNIALDNALFTCKELEKLGVKADEK